MPTAFPALYGEVCHRSHHAPRDAPSGGAATLIHHHAERDAYGIGMATRPGIESPLGTPPTQPSRYQGEDHANDEEYSTGNDVSGSDRTHQRIRLAALVWRAHGQGAPSSLCS